MFLLVYIALLLLPGAAALFALSRKPASFGEIPLTSLGLFVLATAVVGLAGWSAVELRAIYFGAVAASFAAAGWRFTTGVEPKNRITQWMASPDSYTLILAVGLVGYGLWAGPYTEIPADVYGHFGRITDSQEWFAGDNSLKIANISGVFASAIYYWYRFVALCLSLTGAELHNEVGSIAIVNLLIFFGAFFSFAKVVVAEDTRLINVGLTAALATVLLVLHFGVGPFSYIRYYTFGPAFFALAGYFALMVILIQILKQGTVSIRLCLGAILLALAVAALHAQEALYLVVMAAMLFGVHFVRTRRSASANSRYSELGDSKRLVSVLFYTAVTIYVLAHLVLYFTVARNWPLDGGFLQPLSDLFPFTQNLYILKPTQQFYQVLTIWGVFVYLLYALYSRKKEVPAYIAAGMWLPLFTVFNPVFIDLFLRLSFAEVVWRLCYLLPVELFAAWYLVRGWESFRQLGKYSDRFRVLLASVLLCVFLLPLSTRYLENKYSKLHMLAPVSAEADYRQLDDVLGYLNEQSPGDLLTDQVTGYVINAFTGHVYYGQKFYNLFTTATNLRDYDLTDFEQYRGGYLVINGRDGDFSEVGETGGHWASDIRLYSKQYSWAFWQMVIENPDVFSKVWEQDRISVYRISD
ncbi:MAG: hypothetical protein HOM55_05550 [Proteobacteria bacterium]|jgi:hypothetical protein|nr:hypothetical protein [Pseudomonadota bacterium]